MLGVSAMEPVIQFVFYLIAVICFVLVAIGWAVGRVNLIAVGLACTVFAAFMWPALVAS